jgi:hypothetical protein
MKISDITQKLTIQWPTGKEQKDKQSSSKGYKEN